MPKRRAEYKIRDETTWARVEAEYCAGRTALWCASRYDVTEAAIRKRATIHGWSKRAHAARRAAETAPLTQILEPPPGAAEPEARVSDDIGALEVAETALAEALRALSRGDARQAAALIKAGDAVGMFAEFVRNLRSNEPPKAQGR